MNRIFSQILSNYQKQINKELEKLFNKKINQSKQPFLKKVLKLLKEFSLRSGERIRAVLVNCGYFLAGGKNKKAILKASIFIELTHNYLLIHDDILDRDMVRRGKPTIHYYYQKISRLRSKPEKKHYGQSMAIEAGDMMVALSYEILTSSNFPDKAKNLALEKLNQIVSLTAYGQMLELNLRGKKIKEKDVFEIYQSKTVPYSFVGPLQIGAILAGADEKFLNKIEKFALPLGVAFQIKDDISDIKSDIRENQPTLFKKSGSIQYCQKIIEKLRKKTKRIIELEKGFPKKEKQFLLNLADYILSK